MNNIIYKENNKKLEKCPNYIKIKNNNANYVVTIEVKGVPQTTNSNIILNSFCNLNEDIVIGCNYEWSKRNNKDKEKLIKAKSNYYMLSSNDLNNKLNCVIKVIEEGFQGIIEFEIGPIILEKETKIKYNKIKRDNSIKFECEGNLKNLHFNMVEFNENKINFYDYNLKLIDTIIINQSVLLTTIPFENLKLKLVNNDSTIEIKMKNICDKDLLMIFLKKKQYELDGNSSFITVNSKINDHSKDYSYKSKIIKNDNNNKILSDKSIKNSNYKIRRHNIFDNENQHNFSKKNNNNNNKELLILNKKISELKNENIVLKKANQDNFSQINEYKINNKKEINNIIDDYTKEKNEYCKKISILQEENNNFKIINESLKRQIDNLNELKEKWIDEESIIREKAENAYKNQLHNSDIRESKIAKQLKSNELIIKNLKEEISKLNESKNLIEDESFKYKNDLYSANFKIEKKDEEIAYLNAKLKDSNSLKIENHNIKENFSKLENELKILNLNKESLNDNKKNFENKKLELYNNLEKLREENNNLYEENELLRNDKLKELEKNDKLRNELVKIANKYIRTQKEIKDQNNIIENFSKNNSWKSVYENNFLTTEHENKELENNIIINKLKTEVSNYKNKILNFNKDYEGIQKTENLKKQYELENLRLSELNNYNKKQIIDLSNKLGVLNDLNNKKNLEIKDMEDRIENLLNNSNLKSNNFSRNYENLENNKDKEILNKLLNQKEDELLKNSNTINDLRNEKFKLINIITQQKLKLKEFLNSSQFSINSGYNPINSNIIKNSSNTFNNLEEKLKNALNQIQLLQSNTNIIKENLDKIKYIINSFDLDYKSDDIIDRINLIKEIFYINLEKIQNFKQNNTNSKEINTYLENLEIMNLKCLELEKIIIDKDEQILELEKDKETLLESLKIEEY